ncbi:hypothetical protein BX666DRAFT_1827171, partial [Dichotomocladium elegans]
FRISYSDRGDFNLEARLASATDLRSLIDAFSQLCTASSPSPISTPATTPSICSGIVLYRNRSLLSKPANFFASVSALGQHLHPHSKHRPVASLQAIIDVCLQTYFTCWVRHVPLLQKEEFLSWYNKQQDPTNTLIVNAICCYTFRHTIIHHASSNLARFFVEDVNRIREQEEFFFNRARDCLAQSFDSPDRHMVVALLLMCTRAHRSKLHHYAGMAVSALHGLDIYPRTAPEEGPESDESYEKEMDTRLWWYAWAIDFYLYSSFGAPRSTPQTRVPGTAIDPPRIFEQDVDEAAEMGVLALTHCLELWKIQSDIVEALYENESSDMTVEQLQAFDTRILAFYRALPAYLQLDSGFEYGSEDLFMVCLRVNMEYNATRILLHKLFIPDINDRHPSHFSLQSLNICVSTALRQLRTLNTATRIHKYRCSFDRDELWRASEIISIAMDVHRSCGSDVIFAQDVDLDEYNHGLEKALETLKATRDYQIKVKDWTQVADWLEVEIRRHKLYYHGQPPSQTAPPRRASAPDYFLATLKPSARQSHRPPSNTDADTAESPPIPKIEESHHELTPSGSMLSQQPSPPLSASSSSSKSFVQFSPYTPPSPISSPSGNNTNNHHHHHHHGPKPSQTRFRYFNPRKMNKFLFIDENPIL